MFVNACVLSISHSNILKTGFDLHLEEEEAKNSSHFAKKRVQVAAGRGNLHSSYKSAIT